ncbi:MAG: hypothetical protein U1E69_13505 [Tabrizicola sp.]|uniref:hypothetical protein n=1 Tax=Tabrizicola sp. TaxID=2005166 RepID=UPI002ABC6ABC|nr:hypothetical protein [Tabrizicola sp.]MDZ4087804.1 hypothetical protein [Tabrizicola sp.]
MRWTVILVLGLGLAGCVGTAPAEDGLYYTAPATKGVDFVATDKDPAAVAMILREAGLGTVRAGATSVTLSSRDLRLIDCGTYVQVAMGNRAEFPATAPEAVLMEGFTTPGLIQRAVDSRSTVRLTRAADGSGYAISEVHSVTRRYQALGSSARSKATVAFDQGSAGTFTNGSLCRSSGLVATLLR